MLTIFFDTKGGIAQVAYSLRDTSARTITENHDLNEDADLEIAGSPERRRQRRFEGITQLQREQ